MQFTWFAMMCSQTKPSGRKVWLLVFLLLASTLAFGGGNPRPHISLPRRTRTASDLKATPDGSLTITLVDVSGGAPLFGSPSGPKLLDCGDVSYGSPGSSKMRIQQGKESFVVSTEIGLLVKDATNQAHFATISGSLSNPQSPLTYRIDGKTLGSSPAVLVSHAIVGTVSRHHLEIEVPTSLTESAADTQIAIQFNVIPE